MPGASSVSLGAWVRVGGRDESADLAGASHFLEHLLFKGTERRSAREIAASVDSVGREMNALTPREYTTHYARLHHAPLARRPGHSCAVLKARPISHPAAHTLPAGSAGQKPNKP